MMFAVPFLHSSCNSQSCCNSQAETTSNAVTSATCKGCDKSTCDKNCTSNPSISSTGKKVLPSCSLTAEAQNERGNGIIKQVFSRAKTIKEMSNGWDLVFPHSSELVAELQEIAAFERKCCASFTWEVVEDSTKKLAHLKISGSQAIKEELKSGFEQFGLAHLVAN